MPKRSTPESPGKPSPLVRGVGRRRAANGAIATPADCRHAFIPPDLPDEALISDVGRYHILSANHTITQTYQELFHCSPFSLNAWIPPHLAKLASHLPGDVAANTRALLQHKTLFPLLQLFSGLTFPESPLTLRSNRRLDEARPPGNLSADNAIQYPKRLTVEPTRLCVKCMHEDLKSHGVPYIHRSHQIPGVEVCAKHGVSLIDRCFYCSCWFDRPKQLVLTPWRPCLCHHYLLDSHAPVQKSSNLVALSYARFTRDLLLAPSMLVQPEALVAAYKQRARDLGYTRGTNIDRNRLFAEIEQYYGRESLSKVDDAYQKNRLTGWFNLINVRFTSEVPLGRHLLFAHFLFRDAGAFWRAVLHPLTVPLVTDDSSSASQQVAPSRGNAKKVPAAAQTKAKRVQELQRKLLRAAREMGICTIESLWRKKFGVLKQLTTLEPIALARLTEQLKAIKPGNRPAPNRPVRPHPEDEARARKVREAAEKLYASIDKPERVSANRLSRAVGWNLVSLNKDRFPATRSAVEEQMESNWYFYARRIVWALLTLREDSARAIRDLCGVEYYRGKVLIAHFSEIDTSLPLAKGTVVSLLQQRGIDRHWEGPCPAREFPQAGRAFYYGRT
ncbi:MAG TPA: TniQ family protein [Noviherbaspirillum sp.]|nr:TniQ family protein [Noviherbaspirillum sp.]